MHFWNREKEILAELNTEYNVLLIIDHEENKNYSLLDITNYCNNNKISSFIVENTIRRARNPQNILRAIKILSKIKKFKPDLIYIESFSDPYFSILCLLFLKKSKVIIALMDYELHPYEENRVRFSDKFYQVLYLKFFNNFQLFSSQQAKALKKDYPQKNLYFIPLYLIKNDFVIPSETSKDQNGITNFLFFGKIHYYKGVDILIKAGNILASRYTNFKIIIAGYCENFSDYAKQIENKDIYEIQISYLSKQEIRELMLKADILVLPYRQVTQSGPLMMAFNLGVIPLASDLPGFQELIINRYNGFLFKNNSVDDLVKAMEDVILMSDSNRQILRENLIKYVAENYNLNKFVNNYKLMFDSVAGNK